MFSLARTLAAPRLGRGLHLGRAAAAAVGDAVPPITLYEASPAGKVELAQLCAGKKE